MLEHLDLDQPFLSVSAGVTLEKVRNHAPLLNKEADKKYIIFLGSSEPLKDEGCPLHISNSDV